MKRMMQHVGKSKGFKSSKSLAQWEREMEELEAPKSSRRTEQQLTKALAILAKVDKKYLAEIGSRWDMQSAIVDIKEILKDVEKENRAQARLDHKKRMAQMKKSGSKSAKKTHRRGNVGGRGLASLHAFLRG